ncbi:type I-G CRISPR-associated protein Csb2 [Sorangium cellulosum]|uniref:Type I-U CRISPR-associated protein Cas5/Cas6 n=1 Tax=Sorangium cellulosum TaxID=56 RepID=A0A150QEC4_SORCE|nr:type I-U CRISPR-associated protein Csb2 [Sorangium cellulosum]KYF66263.1 type I-U CRISPR-associated protein Cas5/Cas6 [Sorangium cellulosum]
MLAIEVALLTGRYVATAVDDRNRAEWPPHPARLFSALVDAHFEALDPSTDERDALEWLEQQGPPEITAPEATAREVVTVFVPVNDTSVVGSLDDEALTVREARAELDAARPKGGKPLAAAEKKFAKAEARFLEAVRKAIAPVPAGKEGKDGPGKASSILPERRTRQPRTFPSSAPSEMDPAASRIVFAWPSATPTPEQRSTLDTLAARVTRLGHSSSLVTVRVRDDRPEATWIPDDTSPRRAGDDAVLRVVGPGQLAALCAAFELQADTPGRVMPASFQRYVRPRHASVASAPAPLLGDGWIVLRRVAGPRLPSIRAVDVARTVRKAMMAAYGPGAPEILSGHRASGGPSERPHLAYVPLPFVGSEHADGAILGVALILPRDATRDERLAVYRALDAWERQRRHEDEEAPTLPVHLGRTGELVLARIEEQASPSTLRPATWCAESTSWASATPVALDRNPGDLGARDPQKEAAAYAEAEATLAAACERIGLPRPSRVTVLPAAPITGADKARRFPPFHAGKPPVQRVLVHATLTFDAPVRGPILLGAGRYFGLGLFRPLRGHG